MTKLIEFTATTPQGNNYAFKNATHEGAAGYVQRNFVEGTTFKKDKHQQGKWISENGFEGEFENMRKTI